MSRTPYLARDEGISRPKIALKNVDVKEVRENAFSSLLFMRRPNGRCRSPQGLRELKYGTIKMVTVANSRSPYGLRELKYD